MTELDTPRVLTVLNSIMEQELAGVIRYTHYSLLVYGYNRIPIIGWLREQAVESLGHAQKAGGMVTHLGAYPSLEIGPLLDSHKHDIGQMLRESLDPERQALPFYKELLTVAELASLFLPTCPPNMCPPAQLP